MRNIGDCMGAILSLGEMLRERETPPDLNALGDLPTAEEEGTYMGGPYKRYHYANGFGASVVCHVGTYGYPTRWELAVLKWHADGSSDLTYRTPITNDVLPHLTAEDVVDLLKRIEALSADCERDDYFSDEDEDEDGEWA